HRHGRGRRTRRRAVPIRRPHPHHGARLLLRHRVGGVAEALGDELPADPRLQRRGPAPRPHRRRGHRDGGGGRRRDRGGRRLDARRVRHVVRAGSRPAVRRIGRMVGALRQPDDPRPGGRRGSRPDPGGTASAAPGARTRPGARVRPRPATWLAQGDEDAMNLAVGVDAGGTSTRAWVVDSTGHVLGQGGAGGGNPNSHPPESAAEAMVEATEAAMAGLDPTEVRAWVIGMAGRSKLTDPDVAAVFERAWERLGFPHAPRPRLVTDAEAAFVSATAEPDGTVLVAGTGSIAGRIRGRSMVSTVGGYGWLLGDEGDRKS